MLGGRGVEIINSILEGNGEKSIKKLSEELSLTERAVRYEIEKIEEYLKDENLMKKNESLKVVKGNIILENIQMIEEALEKNYSLEFLTPKEREMYMLSQILFKRIINLREISEKLDVSRNTLKLYLKEITQYLNIYEIELKTTKKGLEIEGEEEKIRLCALNFLTQLKHNKNKLFKATINEMIPIDNIQIKAYINYCQKIMQRVVSDEAYEIIKNYLKICIYLLKENRILTSIKNERFLEDTEEYAAVTKAGTLLEAAYDIEIPKIEYLKITDFFLGSHAYNFKFSYYENWVKMELLIKKLIESFNGRIDVDISNDKILLEGLINHLKPTIYRIQNGIKLENSIHLEVAESYPHLFVVTKEIIKPLEEYLETEISDDEAAFLTIHFKAAMDRNRTIAKNKKKVLVVCGLGYGTSKLLAQQLKENFSIEIIDIIPMHTINKYIKNEDIDVVITTVHIEEGLLKVPSVKVNPILTPEDIKKIRKVQIEKRRKKYLLSEFINEIEKTCTINDKEELCEGIKRILNTSLIDDIFVKKITIFDTLKKSRIKLKEEVNTWEEAVRKAGKLLVEDGCVTENYVYEMVKSVEDYGSYMVMGDRIAFPHGKNYENVNETAFSLITLKNEVNFPGDIPVKAVIAFSSKDNKEHLDPFMEIIEMLEEEKFNVEKIVKKF